MSNRRYKVKDYNELTNFSVAEPYEDKSVLAPSKDKKKNEEIESKQKDLLMSELYELKNMWFLYNKKINNLLVVLP